MKQGRERQTLRAGIGELGQSRMEQLVLFPKGLVLLIDMRLRNLECHVFIGDLWDIRKEEHNSKAEDEDANSEVNPLHALQRCYIIRRLGEEGIRAKHRADDSTDCIEGLGEVDTDFGVARRTADW
jgi:hypothetical protein